MIETLFVILLSCSNLNSALDCMQQVIDVSEILPSCEAHGEIMFQSGATKRPIVAGLQFVCQEMPNDSEWARLRDLGLIPIQ